VSPFPQSVSTQLKIGCKIAQTKNTRWIWFIFVLGALIIIVALIITKGGFWAGIIGGLKQIALKLGMVIEKVAIEKVLSIMGITTLTATLSSAIKLIMANDEEYKPSESYH
jgi:hypothetical protein